MHWLQEVTIFVWLVDLSVNSVITQVLNGSLLVGFLRAPGCSRGVTGEP